MVLSKDTKLCISIAQHPGNTGTRIQNALYERHGCDFIYKAMKVNGGDCHRALEGVRALGIRGCSVSMPHKMKACELVEMPDDVVSLLRVTNTIVNHGMKLAAHNTDYEAADRVIGELIDLARARDVSVTRAMVMGAGATARSVCLALSERGLPITIANRTSGKTRWFRQKFGAKPIALDSFGRTSTQGAIVINTTSVGMDSGLNEAGLSGVDIIAHGLLGWPGLDPECIVFDVVNRNTAMIEIAEQRKVCAVMNGQRMAAWQSVLQFQLYTGVKLDDPEQEVEHMLTLLRDDS